MSTLPPREKFIGQDPNKNPSLRAQDENQMFPIYRENIRAWLPGEKSAKILDFGCGYGTFLRFLASEGYREATGFDPDLRCVTYCQSNGSAPVAQAEDPFLYLQSHEGNLQALSVLNVLSYLERERLQGWFSLFRDKLAPGGVLVIDVPNAAGFTGMTDFIQDPFMKSLYTDVLLRSLAEGAGLEIVKLGALRLPNKGWKRFLWQTARKAWFGFMKLIYLLERGRSDRNPCVLDAHIFLVARRPR